MEISLRNAICRVNKDSLEGFSAGFPCGVTAVVGPEGCGKAALMAVLAGTSRLSAGDLLLSGESVAGRRADYLGQIGHMPEKLDFPRGSTVEKALMQGAAAAGLNRVFARERVETVLSLLGLQQSREDRISACPADTLRRLGIAHAMLPDPAVLLLEEPFAGLLPDERMRFGSILRGLPRGRIVVLATGNPADADTGVDNVIFMLDGKCLLAMPRAKLLLLFAGRVWRVVVPLTEVFNVKMDYVVAYQQKAYAGLQMVVVADEPPPCSLRAVQEAPTVREAYAYCMSKGANGIS